ncbi:MAG: PD40 domain-containing protein [Chloroflexi bacterium]|nr:PD40 domain-containing protein [Chloroflexota bacterium]
MLSLPPNTSAKAAWSPDGETIAILQLDFNSGGGSLTLVDASGGNAREVAVATLHFGTFAGEYVPTLRSYYSGRFIPLWSPDGSQIAIPFLTEEGHGVFIYDVETGELRPVSLSMRGSHLHLPRAWSPDGERLAFELVWDVL